MQTASQADILPSVVFEERSKFVVVLYCDAALLISIPFYALLFFSLIDT
jgi:hypothetical protein